MHRVDPITTRRLLLIPLSADTARAAATGVREALPELVGAVVPETWPGDVAPMLPGYADLVERDPEALGWGPWLAIERDESTVVADLGFKGAPGEEGTVEVGFGTIEVARGRGIASEAVTALVAWSFEHPHVEAVVAECERDNLASARVLEKCGLTRTGVAGTLLTWRIDRPAAGARGTGWPHAHGARHDSIV